MYNSNHLYKHPVIVHNDIRGYVITHASTLHTGNIISHATSLST